VLLGVVPANINWLPFNVNQERADRALIAVTAPLAAHANLQHAALATKWGISPARACRGGRRGGEDGLRFDEQTVVAVFQRQRPIQAGVDWNFFVTARARTAIGAVGVNVVGHRVLDDEFGQLAHSFVSNSLSNLLRGGRLGGWGAVQGGLKRRNRYAVRHSIFLDNVQAIVLAKE